MYLICSSSPDSLSSSCDMQLCHASRSTGEWAVAEGVLTTLVTAALGNETMCRRLLRVGLDQLIDAAEDDNDSSSSVHRTHQETMITGHQHTAGNTKDTSQHRSKTKKKHHLPAMPGSAASSLPSPRSPPTTCSPPRGPATDGELGLDQIDQIGVDGVLRQSSNALALRMQGESRKTCSALAISLLQALGPFNYVSHLLINMINQPDISISGVHRVMFILQEQGRRCHAAYCLFETWTPFPSVTLLGVTRSAYGTTD